MSRQAIMGLLKQDDWYDEWGTAMSWFFAVADVLYHESAEEIPAEWEYRHSPINDCSERQEDWPTAQLFDMYKDNTIDDDDLLHAGNVLSRYTDWLRAAGKDY